jgi:hypothetical protein
MVRQRAGRLNARVVEHAFALCAWFFSAAQKTATDFE